MFDYSWRSLHGGAGAKPDKVHRGKRDASAIDFSIRALASHSMSSIERSFSMAETRRGAAANNWLRIDSLCYYVAVAKQSLHLMRDRTLIELLNCLREAGYIKSARCKPANKKIETFGTIYPMKKLRLISWQRYQDHLVVNDLRF
jgi:hypothetical protein